MEDRRLLERRDGDLVGDAERIGQEFLEGFLAVDRIDRPAITVFGSARITERIPSTPRRVRSAGCWRRPASRS